MNFTYNGNRYRLVFRHDPPCDLAAHRSHNITILPVAGRMRVYCLQCKTHIAPRSPKHDARNTTCYIQGYLNPSFPGLPYGWVTIREGRSKLNVKEGDRFSKSIGREAALEAALDLDWIDEDDFQFYHACHAAYAARKLAKQ